METSTGNVWTQNTDNATENSGRYKESLDATIWYCASGITICCLNAVCATAILRGRLHKEENRFLFMASLAVADSLLGFTLFVSTVIILMTENIIVCYVSYVLRETMAIADVFCLCLLTTDQFLRIELHMKYPVYATFKNACFALVGVLIFCSAQVVVASLVWHYSAKNNCDYLSLPRWYHIYSNLGLFLFPLLVIVSMHIRIVYISRAQWKKLTELAPVLPMRKTDNHASPHSCHKNGTAHLKDRGISTVTQIQHNQTSGAKAVCPCGHNDTHQARKQWKAVITISVLVGVFLCGWVPPNLVVNLLVFNHNLPIGPTVQKLLEVISNLYVINPLLNPFIYIARVPEVKKQIKKMMASQFKPM